MDKIVIAIDGHAACGKSTTAKLVARKLGYLYIDSGSMYRAVSLHFLRGGIPFDSENTHMLDALHSIDIGFMAVEGSDFPQVSLNGEWIESEIRKPEISAIVSQVSVHRSVRNAMVAQQQKLGESKGVVMDGRDIGTVVFPDAELKIFLTADLQTRAFRRMKEWEAKGITAKMDEVIANLKMRDHVDSTREVGPLKQADDAIVIDTTHLTIEAQAEQVCELAFQRMGTNVKA